MATVVESVAEGCKQDFLGGGSKKGGEKDGIRISALGRHEG